MFIGTSIACIHHGENVICLNRFHFCFSAISVRPLTLDCLQTDCVRLNVYLHNFFRCCFYGFLNSWHFYYAFYSCSIVAGGASKHVLSFQFRTHTSHTCSQLKYDTKKRYLMKFEVFADLTIRLSTLLNANATHFTPKYGLHQERRNAVAIRKTYIEMASLGFNAGSALFEACVHGHWARRMSSYALIVVWCAHAAAAHGLHFMQIQCKHICGVRSCLAGGKLNIRNIIN